MAYPTAFSVLFGDNAILVFLIIIVMIFVFIAIYRWSAVLTFPIMLLIGYEYFTNATIDQIYLWFALISWCVAVISVIRCLRK